MRLTINTAQRDLNWTFNTNLNAVGIPSFACAGSAAGYANLNRSYAWDDDTDIYIRKEDLQEVKTTLLAKKPWWVELWCENRGQTRKINLWSGTLDDAIIPMKMVDNRTFSEGVWRASNNSLLGYPTYIDIATFERFDDYHAQETHYGGDKAKLRRWNSKYTDSSEVVL